MESLITIIGRIKLAAANSGLTNQVVLVKSEDDIEELSSSSVFRAVYISVDSVDILTKDDSYEISFSIVDKAQSGSDEAYLHSIEESVDVLRHIADSLNYSAEDGYQYVTYGNIDIRSGKTGSDMITWIDAVMNYAITALPNIHI